MPSWLLFALLSALFAALTAVFAKAGLRDIHSDLATTIRTAIIRFITRGIVLVKGRAGELPAYQKIPGFF